MANCNRKIEKIVGVGPFGGLNPLQNHLLSATSLTKWPLESFDHGNTGPSAPKGSHEDERGVTGAA